MHKGCNMKGFLDFQVLSMINKKNLSGSEIRFEIGKRRGCIPSPGTIYPVLKDLQCKHLIKEKNNHSKEKKYFITVMGKKEFQKNRRLFIMLFKDLF